MKKNQLSNTDYSDAHPQILIKNRLRISMQIKRCFEFQGYMFDSKKTRILDLGCSNGAILYPFTNWAKICIGLDTDKNAISSGQKLFSGKYFNLRVFDGENISYKDSYFDLIIFRRTYGSVENLSKLVMEINRVLKTNGLIYFEGHNKLFPWEDDYLLPFLPLLSPKFARKYIFLQGYKKFYLGNYQSFWQLKNAFKRFKITNLTPTIIKKPLIFNFTKLYKYQKFLKFIPSRLLRILEPVFPDFIWVLQK